MAGRYEADLFIGVDQLGSQGGALVAVARTGHDWAELGRLRSFASSGSGLSPKSEPVVTLVVEAIGDRLPGAPKALRPGDACPELGSRPEVVVDYDAYGDWNDENFKTYQCTLVANDDGNRWCKSAKGNPYVDREVATYRLRPGGWSIEMGGSTHFIPEVQCEEGKIARTTRK